MKVKVMNRLYAMSKEEYKKVLKIASEQVPMGIYAIEKGDYAELMNLKCNSITQLKDKGRAYRQQGYRVYSNRGTS